MSDLAVDICIVTATRMEAERFVSVLTESVIEKHGSRRVWTGNYGGTRVAVVTTGIGPARAAGAAELIAALPGCPAVLNVGLAGSLATGMHAHEWYEITHVSAGEDDGEQIHLNTIGLMPQATLVTVKKAVCDRGRARALHMRHGVELVDMECYHLCRAARSRGLRIYALKMISDAADIFTVRDVIRSLKLYRKSCNTIVAKWMEIYLMTRNSDGTTEYSDT